MTSPAQVLPASPSRDADKATCDVTDISFCHGMRGVAAAVHSIYLRCGMYGGSSLVSTLSLPLPGGTA